MSLEHLMYLRDVVEDDIVSVHAKEGNYNGSWKKRGGVGAFFITARKWDALENLLLKNFGYDVFKGALEQGEGDGTVLDQIRDLRRYLALIESEVLRLRGAGATIAGAVESRPGGAVMPRVPHTAEYIGETVHKHGLHQGSVYLCFNIERDSSRIYIRNSYNEMAWHDASLFRLTYNEGE